MLTRHYKFWQSTKLSVSECASSRVFLSKTSLICQFPSSFLNLHLRNPGPNYHLLHLRAAAGYRRHRHAHLGSLLLRCLRRGPNCFPNWVWKKVVLLSHFGLQLGSYCTPLLKHPWWGLKASSAELGCSFWRVGRVQVYNSTVGGASLVITPIIAHWLTVTPNFKLIVSNFVVWFGQSFPMLERWRVSLRAISAYCQGKQQ